MFHLTALTYIFLIARVWNNLGEVAREQGRYEEAIVDFSRAHELDSADAASLYNLGTVYRRLGRYGDGERVTRQALAVWEKAAAVDASKLAAAYSLLAGLRFDQGRHKEALRDYDRALALDPASAGVILLNRAIVFDAERRYEQAESDLRKALAMLEQASGPRHPRTLACLNAFGLVEYHRGRYHDAEELLRRAVELKEQTLAPAHPDLAASLTNLGAVYVAQARYAEAEATLKRSLSIQSRALGLAHPNTGGTMMEYAKVLRATRRKSEAARIEAQARGARSAFAGHTIDIGALACCPR